MRSKFLLPFALVVLPITGFAQAVFPKDEFTSRREKLFTKIGSGLGIVWGTTPALAPVLFKQAPDFYYLSGIEEENAILLLIGASKRTVLFANRTEGESRWTSPGVWQAKDLMAEYGINQLLPFEDFWETLSQYSQSGAAIYLPMTPVDNMEMTRREANDFEQKLLRHPVQTIPMWKRAIQTMRELLPQASFQNINPHLDDLRKIKSAYEIEQLKISGKVGAEGVLEAIRSTKPGMYEYEIAAAATYIYLKKGTKGQAFAPIVASGRLTYIPHYQKNEKQIATEDIVLMDNGCDYNYYTSDITRVWPASGKFTTGEEKMYRCVLEARNKIIAAMKPGVSFRQLRDILFEVYEKHGFTDKVLSWNGYLGHYVGLSVHEGVSPLDTRLEAGMVFNVEPVLDNPEKRIHMRIEDTVLVTDTGAINLTGNVPAELDEIYKLMRQKESGK